MLDRPKCNDLRRLCWAYHAKPSPLLPSYLILRKGARHDFTRATWNNHKNQQRGMGCAFSKPTYHPPTAAPLGCLPEPGPGIMGNAAMLRWMTIWQGIYTLPSLKVDLVWGGLLEDLGPILALLAVMVTTNWKPLKNRYIHLSKIKKLWKMAELW